MQDKIILKNSDGELFVVEKIRNIKFVTSLHGGGSFLTTYKWWLENSDEIFDEIFWPELNDPYIGKKFGYRDLTYEIIDISS